MSDNSLDPVTPGGAPVIATTDEVKAYLARLHAEATQGVEEPGERPESLVEVGGPR